MQEGREYVIGDRGSEEILIWGLASEEKNVIKDKIQRWTGVQTLDVHVVRAPLFPCVHVKINKKQGKLFRSLKLRNLHMKQVTEERDRTRDVMWRRRRKESRG